MKTQVKTQVNLKLEQGDLEKIDAAWVALNAAGALPRWDRTSYMVSHALRGAAERLEELGR